MPYLSLSFSFLLKYIFSKPLLLFFFFLSVNLSYSQERHWGELIVDPKVKFEEVKDSFDEEWENKEYEKGKGFKQFRRWENFWENRLLPNGDFPIFSKAFNEYVGFQSSFSTTTNSADENQWTAVGPLNYQYSQSWSPGQGRVNCIEEDPNNNQIIYVGTPSGGLWKSIDGGVNWLPKSDFLSVIGISSIAINPSNSLELYIATGDADGGDTYSIGIWKSIDGGDNWSQTSFPSFQANKLEIDPYDNNKIWAASNSGLYNSYNGGLDWQLVFSGNVRDFSLSPNNSNIFYFSTSNEVFYSLDGGETINQSEGLLSEKSRITITVSNAEPNSVYILTAAPDQSFAGVYKSTNNAQNFILQNNSTDIFDGSTQAYYDMAMVVSDQDANFLVAGVLNLWKSNNGGIDWTPVNSWSNPSQSAYTHADIHFLKYFENNLYCGSDGGIYKSTDDALNFTDLSQKLQIGQFYKISSNQINPYIISGGLQDNGGFYYNGQDWTVWHGADGMESIINPYNSSEIFGMIQFGSLYSSTDGQSLNYLGAPEDGRWVTPMQYDSVNNKIIAGYSQLYSYSDIGGWQTLSNYSFPSLISEIEIYQNNSDTIYVSEGSNLYVTIDGGLTMSQLSSPTSATITSIEVNKNNPNELWVVQGGWSAGQKIYHSIDMGENWQNISYNLPNLPSNVVKRHHNTNDLYLGMDIGIYHFNDETNLWTSFNGNLPNVIVNDIEISEAFNIVTVGTYGRGVWQSNTFDAELDSIRIYAYQIDSIDNFICSNSIVPSVSYINIGSNDINSLFVNYTIDGNTFSYLWQGNATSGQSFSFELPEIQNLIDGDHTILVEVVEVNGQEYLLSSESLEFNFYSSSGQEHIDFYLLTDCYASETSFSLFDENNEIVYYQNNSLANYSFNQYDFCLQPACYTLVVYDSYGDGVAGTDYSCDSDGNFFLVNQNDDLIFELEDANFGSEVSYNFCLEETITGCLDINANNYNAQVNTADGSCTYDNFQFCDDFESYDDGDPVAESSVYWETWATSYNNWLTPPYIDDTQISSGQSVSGFNALYFPFSSGGGPQDIVLPFTQQPSFSNGYFEISFNIFVPDEKGAYLNFQQNHTPGNWLMNAEIFQNQIFLSDGNNFIYFDTIIDQTIWNTLSFKFDLFSGTADLFINSELVFSDFVDIYEIGALNLYPVSNNEFWIDDVCYLVDSDPFGCTDTSASNYDVDAFLSDNSLCCYQTNTFDIQVHCNQYTWIDGITYTENNNSATFTYTNDNGCDSVVNLLLTINQADTIYTTIESCEDYYWNGQVYSEPGVYFYETINIDGCTEVSVLELSSCFIADCFFSDGVLVDSPASFYPDTTELSPICSGSFYNQEIQFYVPFEIGHIVGAPYYYNNLDVSGFPIDSLVLIDIIGLPQGLDYNCNSNNCLFVGNTIDCFSIFGSSNEVGLHELVFVFEGYTNVLGTAISYFNTIGEYLNINGYQIQVNESYSSNENVIACGSYFWNGQTYYESGTYEYNTISSTGCDSTAVLNLTINNPSFSTDVQVHCAEYTWIDGVTYTESNNSAIWTLEDANGCDSIISLDLTIYNHESSTISAIACDEYFWDGEFYTESGSYTKLYNNVNGCDSTVTLELIINNSDATSSIETACDEFIWDNEVYTESGNYSNIYTNVLGCDSTHTLGLIINSTTYSIDEQLHCDQYTWIDGETYSESNNSATFTLTNSNSCDLIVMLDLTINDSDEILFSETACDEFVWGDETYTESGIYTNTYINANGCDSIVVLELTIINSNEISFSETACDEFIWDDEIYTESGIYTVTYTNVNGCDSIVTLNLTIINSDEILLSETACDEFIWDDETYTESGIYTNTYINANGCDSIVVLELTIINSNEISFSETACDEFIWDDEIYTESGIYTITHTNSNNCDSIITLDLIVNPSTFYSESITQCDTYTWTNGVTYSESGEYTYVSTNSYDCPQTNVLDLTINDSFSLFDTVIVCDEYLWKGNSYTESGDYTFDVVNKTGCDSAFHLNLNISEFDLLTILGSEVALIQTSINAYTIINSTIGSTYHWNITNELGFINAANEDSSTINISWGGEVGVDTICVYEEDEWGCLSEADCMKVNVQAPVSIEEVDKINLNIYPNPFSNETSVIFSNPERSNVDLKLIDSRGRVVREYCQIRDNHIVIERENLERGLYYIQVELNNQIQRKTVVIQ